MASSPALVAGRTLGHYRVLEEIGAGGMGVVYRAHDERLERDVALKILPPRALADDSARRRFRREALVLSHLNHPNISTVYDFDQQEGIDFLVTELAAGRPLDERVAAGALAEKEVVQLGLQLADGLEAAHREGVIHRDLKPANLRLTGDGRLKILDFGLARQLDPADQESLTQSLAEPSRVAGTLAYMAPEQLRGEKVDARSDLWSAGVVLYELSTGRRPFEGKTTNALADEIFHGVAASPSVVQPKLSPRLGEIILKCLEKDRENRYQSAKELLVDLRRLSLPTTMAAGATRRWSRRRTLLTAVAGSLLLVLWVWFSWFRTPATSAPKPASRESVAATRLSTGATASPATEANEYFEKAMLFLTSQYDLPRGRQMLERALALDPHFAEARAWYGFTDVLMVDSGYSNDSSWFYKAEQEARQALRDDPNSGRAHSVLAAAYLSQGRKELVPAEIEKALAANPAEQDARIWLVNYHELNGDYAAAEALLRSMLDAQPLFFPARMNLGDVAREKGEIANAVLQYEKIFEVDPGNSYIIVKLARTYMDAGELRKARAVLDKGRPQDRQQYETRLTWAMLLALEGNKKDAAKEIDPELTKYCQVFVWAMLPMADYHAVMGDTNEALAWLQRAVANGDERVEYFRRDPHLAALRSLPRFQQILESTAYRRQQRPQIPRESPK